MLQRCVERTIGQSGRQFDACKPEFLLASKPAPSYTHFAVLDDIVKAIFMGQFRRRHFHQPFVKWPQTRGLSLLQSGRAISM